MPERILVILSIDLPVVAEITSVLAAIDPPRIPYFAGDVRIIANPTASALERWLDEPDHPNQNETRGNTP